MKLKRILLLAVFSVAEICLYIGFIAYNILYMEREVNEIIPPLVIIGVILTAVWLFIFYFPMLNLFQRGKNYTKDVFNGVEWRWEWVPAGPMIKGAFCTKCGGQLEPVKAAESWQADLKCTGCGRTFVSFPNSGAEAGRSFTETKRLVEKQILANTQKSNMQA